MTRQVDHVTLHALVRAERRLPHARELTRDSLKAVLRHAAENGIAESRKTTGKTIVKTLFLGEPALLVIARRKASEPWTVITVLPREAIAVEPAQSEAA